MRVIQSIPRDSIPSVDDPEFDEQYEGKPEDLVIALDFDADPARAYPARYLDYHEVVNDVIGDQPIAVSWCPLCGSGVAYDRRVEGRTLTFGVSGKLADDNLVLYDRETGSNWKQSTGECIAGELEGSGLDLLPAAMTAWEEFTEDYPDGVVLQAPGGQSISSGESRDSEDINYSERAFGPYFESETFGRDAFYDLIGRDPDEQYREPREWDREDISPKTVVLGVERDGDALAVPEPALGDHGVKRLEIGEGVVVFGTPDGLHAFVDPGFDFDTTDEPGAFQGDGTRWNGRTGQAVDGHQLNRVPAVREYAFTWQDDHGRDAFVEGE